MFDESIVQVSDGELVRVPELSAHLTVGERGPVSHPNIIMHSKAYINQIGHTSLAWWTSFFGNARCVHGPDSTIGRRYGYCCEAHCTCGCVDGCQPIGE